MNTSKLQDDGKLNRLAALLAAAVASWVVVLYWPAHAYAFGSFDDPTYVTTNPIVRAGITLQGLRYAFTTTDGFNYQPLVWIVEMLVVSCFGVSATAFHVLNITLHAASSALLLLFFFRSTRELSGSTIAAAVFAVHPLRVESVVWVAELKDCLSVVLLISTLLLWGSYVQKGGRKGYCFAIATYAAGLCAKPTLVTLPLLLLLLDEWPFRRARSMRLLVEKIPFAILSAVACAMTLIAQSTTGAIATGGTVSAIARLENAVLSLGQYLWDTLWPTKLSIVYPVPAFIHRDVESGPLAFSCFTLFAITAVVVWFWRRGCRAPMVGWIWYLISLVPMSGIVQVGLTQRADRFTYIPHIGLMILLLWAVSTVVGRVARRFQNAWYTFAGLAVIALSVCTHNQLWFWRDDLTLTQRALELDPDNYLARLIRGQVLLDAGEPARSAEQFSIAVRLLPSSAKAQRYLAESLTASGRSDLAMPHWQFAFALDAHVLDPRPHARFFYALALAQHAELTQAAEQWSILLDQTPGDIQARCCLAMALRGLGKTEQAREQLEIGLKQDPNSMAIKSQIASFATTKPG